MSLDIDLGKRVDFGSHDGPEWCEAYSANITHNLKPMWRLAGVHDALYESHGKLASDIAETLDRGVEFMRTHPDECRRLDSPNGWGLYVNALPWLERLAEQCRQYPNAEIRISK